MRLGLWWLAAFSCLVLMGCEPSGPTHTGAGVYVIREKDTDEVRARMLESVNFLRQSAGIAPVTINPLLTEAALRHSEDMSRQQRAWLDVVLGP
ncbi:MAG: CAP domain-containing protein, partial [Mangrovicoccus sp.]